jgi:hypothetical protein
MNDKTIKAIKTDLAPTYKLALDKYGVLSSKSANDDAVTARLESKGWTRTKYDVAYGGFSSTATLVKGEQEITVTTGEGTRGCKIRVIRGL